MFHIIVRTYIPILQTRIILHAVNIYIDTKRNSLLLFSNHYYSPNEHISHASIIPDKKNVHRA